MTFDKWISSGVRIQIKPHSLAGEAVEIFTKTLGEQGPHITFLHGFPTSSMDWHKIIASASDQFRVLLLDLPGFGESDKPRNFPYSIKTQAECVEEVWKHFKISETFVVSHDYSDSIVTELLTRKPAASFTKLEKIVMLNGGLYADFHKPVLIQKVLLNRLLGPPVSRLINFRAFQKQFRSIFSSGHPPTDEEIEEQWKSIKNRSGLRNYSKLIGYIGERRRESERWESALKASRVPTQFVWGLADPVSGIEMAEAIHRNLPHSEFVGLKGIGHHPQLEAPEIVIREILKWFRI